jgi:archaellin
MKRLIIVTASIVATVLLNSSLGISQPSETGGREPGFWQPETDVNVNLPINITLVNNTEISLEYSIPDGGFQQIGSGTRVGLGNFLLNPTSETDQSRNLNVFINSPVGSSEVPLHFDITSVGNDVIITIRPAMTGERIDRGFYTDEKGRIYAF